MGGTYNRLLRGSPYTEHDQHYHAQLLVEHEVAGVHAVSAMVSKYVTKWAVRYHTSSAAGSVTLSCPALVCVQL
jgi:hypothetical protein